jgi:uncharacterized protein (UPF0254 family)
MDVPSACTVPSVTGRKKLLSLAWPTAMLPPSATAVKVANEASDSAIAM